MLEVNKFYLIQDDEKSIEFLLYLFPNKKSFIFWATKTEFNTDAIIENENTWELFRRNHPICYSYIVREVSMVDLLTSKDPLRSFAKEYYIKFEKPLKVLKELQQK